MHRPLDIPNPLLYMVANLKEIYLKLKKCTSDLKVRRFKSGRGRWIFSDRKNPEYDFLWKVSKAMGPVS